MNNSLKKSYILSFPALSTQHVQPAGIPRMQPDRNRQKGYILVVGGIILSVTLLFAGIVIDLTRHKLVQAELQNAADAAALAGAGCLVSIGDAGEVCDNTGKAFPDFDSAQTRAENALVGLNNRSENKTLHDGQITEGYLDYNGDNNIIPPENKDSYKTTHSNSVLIPVVRVYLKRATSNNDGAMDTYFLKLAGISSIPVAATATAGRYNTSAPKKIIPFVVNSCAFNVRSNAANGGTFTISASDSTPGCSGSSGAWTTLTYNFNGANQVRDEVIRIMNNSAQAPVILNQTNIYIKPGAATTLYGNLQSCITNGGCAYANLLIINDSISGDLATKAVNLTCVKLDSSQGGSVKAITIKIAPAADKHYCESIADNNDNNSGPGDVGSTSEISSSRLF